MSAQGKQATGEGCAETTRGAPCCASASSCCGSTEEAVRTEEGIRKTVRYSYAELARSRGNQSSSCCGTAYTAQDVSRKLGYTEEELGAIPEGANLGLGCGNPVALASLKEGETVLDLGSGAGIDCFIAASKVGEGGRVIGVDMTSEMIERARENARKAEFENVEFRLGEIENLPAADNSVDAVISNCVINLATDKGKVFNEAFRVLKPGGRIMVSDIVLIEELPEAIKNSVEAYVGCIAGAMLKYAYLDCITTAGFQDVEVISETSIPVDLVANDLNGQAIIEELNLPREELEKIVGSVASVKVHGVKPTA